jgi:FO synthase
VDGGDARIVFGPEMNIQAPPNLSPGLIGNLIAAGVNDWGGVSPVTPDHVNPERRGPRSSDCARRPRRRASA